MNVICQSGEVFLLKYLVIQRRNALKALLIEKESVTINEVAEKFGISIETVRRDFDALAEEGFLNKIYGGATRRKRTSAPLSLDLLNSTFSAEKARIAARAVRFIKNGDTVFLDSSDTVFRMCEGLMTKEITVLTNSLRVLEKLSASHTIRLICIGGRYFPQQEEFRGVIALDTIRQFQVDRAFITCCSFDFNHGIGTVDEEQAVFKKTIIAHAVQVNLLADHSRFARTSFAKFADFEDITNLFTDARISPQWKEFFEEKGITCYECLGNDTPEASPADAML